MYVSPDFTLRNSHIHTHNTVRRTRSLCLWLQRRSSGSRNPVGKDSFHFYAQLFLRRPPRRDVSPAPPRLLWISNNRLLAVSSGQSASCQARPESDLLSPGLRVVIFARRRRRAAGAQTEGKRWGGKKRTYSHTYHSDSGVFCAMADIRGCFHAT